MKQNAILVGCYALLVLCGGITGYVMANSLASLIMSSVFTVLLLVSAYLTWKNSSFGYLSASALVLLLTLFFGFRFFLTFKFAPAGIMMVLSAILLLWLYRKRPRSITANK